MLKHSSKARLCIVASLLWGATMLISCKDSEPKPTIEDPNTTPTQISYNLKVIYSVNGNKSYSFDTPLLERYELADDPFMEFTKGVYLESYKAKADSTVVDSIENTLVANYAKFLENENLWEAKGNVIATNASGQILKTEQLFWNQETRRIYSDIKTTIYDGEDIIVGDSGFESDEQFGDMVLKKTKGRIEVDPSPTDSTSMTTVADSTVIEVPQTKIPEGLIEPASEKKKSIDTTKKPAIKRIRQLEPIKE